MIPYSGLFSRRLYFANSQFNSSSRKVTSRIEILNHASSHINYLSRFLFSRIGCAFAKFAKYKRLENNPLYGTTNDSEENATAFTVHVRKTSQNSKDTACNIHLYRITPHANGTPVVLVMTNLHVIIICYWHNYANSLWNYECSSVCFKGTSNDVANMKTQLNRWVT